MRPLISKLTPSKGFSQILHILFNLILPFLVFLFVRIGFFQLALSLILLSKWRMFAVRPRFWLANIRANAVDIIIGLSILAFLISTNSEWLQLVWVGIWAVWLIFIKPKSSVLWVSLQSLFGFAAGLMALFLVWDQGSILGLTLAAGLLCFFAAHHFFDSFDEPYTRLLAYTWAWFGSALVWVLSHWLLFYGPIAQPTLLLVTIGFGLGTLYYLDHFDRMTVGLRRQFIFIMVAIVLVVLTFSEWSDKII